MTIDMKAFILDPDKWPLWPNLPMKKPQPASWPLLATLVDDNLFEIGGPLKFPVRLLIDEPGAKPNQTHVEKTYQTVEDLLADGWLVD